jgi:hypothetical protein
MPDIEDGDVHLQSAIEQSLQDQQAKDKITLLTSEGDQFVASRSALVRDR